jgi:hypothetical protein
MKIPRCLRRGASFSLLEKWGFINKSGMLVIESKFGFAGDFKKGLAAISYGGKSGYINQKVCTQALIDYDARIQG